MTCCVHVFSPTQTHSFICWQGWNWLPVFQDIATSRYLPREATSSLLQVCSSTSCSWMHSKCTMPGNSTAWKNIELCQKDQKCESLSVFTCIFLKQQVWLELQQFNKAGMIAKVSDATSEMSLNLFNDFCLCVFLLYWKNTLSVTFT